MNETKRNIASNGTKIVHEQVSKIFIDWSLWKSGNGEKFFVLMEYFKRILYASNYEKNSVEQIEEVLYGKLRRFSAEGINIDNLLIRSIRSFAAYWIRHHDIPKKLPVSDKVFLSIKDRTLDLGDVGKFRFSRSINLFGLNKGWMNVKEAILYREIGKVVVDLVIVRSPYNSDSRRILSRHTTQDETDLVKSFFDLMNKRRALVDMIAMQFTKHDYTQLAGRSVSGGLPSLGKRSR